MAAVGSTGSEGRAVPWRSPRLVALGLLPASEGVGADQARAARWRKGRSSIPTHPNRDDAFYFCTACHSFKMVAAQSMSRERWDESLTFMVKRHNMPDVQGEDREKILDYLEKAFPERPNPRRKTRSRWTSLLTQPADSLRPLARITGARRGHRDRAGCSRSE